MEEDDGVLEFHASSGDLLRAISVKEVGPRCTVLIKLLWYTEVRTRIIDPKGVQSSDESFSLVVFLDSLVYRWWCKNVTSNRLFSWPTPQRCPYTSDWGLSLHFECSGLSLEPRPALPAAHLLVTASLWCYNHNKTCRCDAEREMKTDTSSPDKI